MAVSLRVFLCRAAVFGLLGIAAAGCQRTGSVAGKVSYQNKTVVYGTVLVVATDGNTHQGNIGEDGSYSVQGIRVGDARLAINSPDPTAPIVNKAEQKNPEEDKRRAGLKAKWFPLPRDLGDANKSGLTVQVKGGEDRHDIELK